MCTGNSPRVVLLSRGEAEPNTSSPELARVKGTRSCMSRLTGVYKRFATAINNAGRVVSSFNYEHVSRRSYRIAFSLGTPRFFFAHFAFPDEADFLVRSRRLDHSGVRREWMSPSSFRYVSTYPARAPDRPRSRQQLLVGPVHKQKTHSLCDSGVVFVPRVLAFSVPVRGI